MKIFKEPKFIKKAGCWCLTYFIGEITYFIGEKQHQEWFNTEKEAKEYIRKEGKL